MLGPTVWLMLSGLFYSLRISDHGGTFPKPLTAKEEEYYLTLSAQGDIDARNILVERNLRLVAHIMKKYYAQASEQEDLISIGTIGLIKGISTFKPEKGARLATYAARCIENPILTSRTLTVTMVTLSSKNVMYGVFWTKFPRICISFAVHRILM